MKTVYLACVFVCVLNSGLAPPVDQAGCLFGGDTQPAGHFNVGCSMSCTCNGTSGNIGCVSMCPPMQPNDGCEMVENPDKDEEHSLNCCPIEKCGPPGCLFGGDTQPAGHFNVGCSMSCTCDGTSGNIGCVSMCPPMQPNVGCEMVENPDKDEEHSSNCCPIEKCGPPPAPCVKGNVTIPHAYLMIIGDQMCGCLFGNKTCFPLST